MAVKYWCLDNLQSVSIDNKFNVSFNHHSFITGVRYGITLTENEFYCLHDVILNWEDYKYIGNIPIGKRIWLNNKHDAKQIYNSCTHNYFQFFLESWKIYIKDVHYLIFHCVKKSYGNGGLHLPHNKRYAHDLHGQSYRSRRHKQPFSSSHKIAKRATAHVGNASNKWPECTNFPKRKDTTAGRNFSFRRPANEERASNETSMDYEADTEDTTGDKNSELGSIESCSID